MGINDLLLSKSNGQIIDADDVNRFRDAFKGDFVGRNGSTGAAEAFQNLGTPTIPWGNAYITSLVLNGSIFDPAALVTFPNRIVSGKVRTTSGRPDFIRANGAAPSFTLEAATTNLVLDINSTATVFNTDIVVAGLATAPTTNNTCLVDDTNLTGQDWTKSLGEDGSGITIDTAGSEITNRIGQYSAFKVGTEYFLGYIESATEIRNCFRGYFVNSTGAAINRVALTDNDSIEIMSTAWVFAEDDAVTIDVTYNSPVVSADVPSAPATGDYWLDLNVGSWKRYNGATFDVIDRTLIGIAVIDSTNCIASRSFDFDNAFEEYMPLDVRYVSATQIEIVQLNWVLSVYGSLIGVNNTRLVFDITTDLESGQIEAANTTYYAYVTEVGEPILSETRPYNDKGTLKGFYHPYEAWRCVGYIDNDGSSDFDALTLFSLNGRDKIITQNTASGIWYKRPGITKLFAEVIGGGGAGLEGGGNFNGTNGGTSSFGTFATATGGEGGGINGNDGTLGGNGTGGDINKNGGNGYGRVDTSVGFTGPAAPAGAGGGGGGTPASGSSAFNILMRGGRDFGGAGAGGHNNGSTLRPSGAGGGYAAVSVDVSSEFYVSYTVGAGGTSPVALTDPRRGGDGAQGVVIITEE